MTTEICDTYRFYAKPICFPVNKQTTLGINEQEICDWDNASGRPDCVTYANGPKNAGTSLIFVPANRLIPKSFLFEHNPVRFTLSIKNPNNNTAFGPGTGLAVFPAMWNPNSFAPPIVLPTIDGSNPIPYLGTHAYVGYGSTLNGPYITDQTIYGDVQLTHDQINDPRFGFIIKVSREPQDSIFMFEGLCWELNGYESGEKCTTTPSQEQLEEFKCLFDKGVQGDQVASFFFSLLDPKRAKEVAKELVLSPVPGAECSWCEVSTDDCPHVFGWDYLSIVRILSHLSSLCMPESEVSDCGFIPLRFNNGRFGVDLNEACNLLPQPAPVWLVELIKSCDPQPGLVALGDEGIPAYCVDAKEELLAIGPSPQITDNRSRFPIPTVLNPFNTERSQPPVWLHGIQEDTYNSMSWTTKVVTEPVHDMYFYYGMQANVGSLTNGTEAMIHVGFQYHPEHPHGGALNAGGYLASDNSILPGSVSPLPDIDPADPTTVDYDWILGREYRFKFYNAGPGPIPNTYIWRTEVTDLVTNVSTIVRDNYAPGEFIRAAAFWNEGWEPSIGPEVKAEWKDIVLSNDSAATYWSQFIWILNQSNYITNHSYRVSGPRAVEITYNSSTPNYNDNFVFTA